jgi:hypothetical protein
MPTAARRPTRKTNSGIRLPRVDARTRASRRYLELVQTFESELGYQLTEADRVMIKQAATLTSLRAMFHPPKDKKPPESRVAELWSQNPEQWKWIGWREWSCPFVLEKFYYQRFENGIIFGVLPTSETLGLSQIFAYANTGDWKSTLSEPVEAPACNESSANVNRVPIHGHFVK